MATKYYYNTLPNGRANLGRITPIAVGSIAEGNRHTRKPHEHKREIARRERQQDTNYRNYTHREFAAYADNGVVG